MQAKTALTENDAKPTRKRRRRRKPASENGISGDGIPAASKPGAAARAQDK
jgi:hypothetical protein